MRCQAIRRQAASLWFLLRRKKVWGLALGMAAYNYNFYLFLTWLPGYLSTSLHLDILQSGFYTAVPWLAATVSDLIVGGWLVDHLIRRGHDATRVRQTRPGGRAGARVGGCGSDAHDQSSRGDLLDLDCAVRTGGVGAGRMVDSRTDCTSREARGGWRAS